MSSLENFKSRISNRSAVVGIIGLGYVGLPLVFRFAEQGFRVLGFDIDPEKIAQLNAGKSYIKHLTDDKVVTAIEQGFEATTDAGRAGEVDALLICVPTPLTANREPNMRFVRDTMETFAPHLRKGQMVSLESTTYPGTTEEEVRPCIEAQGLKVGADIFLVYSPEREDPANANFTTRTIPKVCGGSTDDCLQAGVALYEVVIDQVVPVSCTRAAEMTKLLENIHRAVNIGLVNEMKMVADRMGIDIYEVIGAAATKPFGFVPYYPGPGLGGHCIPIDPFYLTWKAREYGINTRFIELAGEVNSNMPAWVYRKVAGALNDQTKSIRGRKILILGIAYKKNVDDPRESPAMVLMEMLRDSGAVLGYSDPHVPHFPKMREHEFDLSSEELNSNTLSQADCVVIITDHDAFDYELIARHANPIVDTRGRIPNGTPGLVRA
ncbi:nucleotide sugar dehydrogenase [Wenzhouxiangella sp. AB-CW3]|uniref:nucleotide sugar dehydrogenase n=1 Tax=Wenzhouxiangella sp. AB-CW3 TaxID=2771012 RepID=UPI00168AE3E5|nr:nucleotide sugar dehydrogenase [Wenzhouxiangella sp. AB-CW3]QOC23759.1 nucleotide sugar dehydrogenase [Wenzhouxiangella sp. AB-CW3]